ncbi:MAG: hypothetical protein R3B06_31925 [Kofleriaceae bacterium]
MNAPPSASSRHGPVPMAATQPSPGAVLVASEAHEPAVAGSNFTLLSAYPTFIAAGVAVAPTVGASGNVTETFWVEIGVAKRPPTTGWSGMPVPVTRRTPPLQVQAYVLWAMTSGLSL